MNIVALRLPDSLHAYAKKMAQEDNASLNQFIGMAVAKKGIGLEHREFFQGARHAR